MDRVNGSKAPEPTLDQLLDELTDDLMRLSDAELLAELEADGMDAEGEAKAARTAIRSEEHTSELQSPQTPNPKPQTPRKIIKTSFIYKFFKIINNL